MLMSVTTRGTMMRANGNERVVPRMFVEYSNMVSRYSMMNVNTSGPTNLFNGESFLSMENSFYTYGWVDQGASD
ncbi:hypothetical protein COX05_01465 [candidate division WWE3 bacterium CG22_combo_CG10-13_8_21_14_all_39_12]|uniref:Uncharacterized protein n=2 Tax=Katanobacteria TaxID=422282 RepID=A0A2M7WZX8_UNCKA|nr:MAG: hypothetical protein COX05_01465 [candidate division WWE3 bacterium CG22_combo_CG10-13_8_21_14_all_39_12]PJA39283.1 MAG: hypothetical protein CO179_05600 [candidate division WWE3 bacterium CG_4_9_14_3_um_filter_39_7]